MTDQIDHFLDELFTALSPLGPSGRRAYAEAESHLLESAAQLEREGASPEAAQRRAIEEFGPLDAYVGGIGAATRLGPRELLHRVLGNAWLLGGLAGSFAGLAGIAIVVSRAIWGATLIASDPAGAVFSAARCQDLREYHPAAATCLQASRLHHADEIINSTVAVGLLGAAALLVFWWARHRHLPGLTRLAAATQPGLVAVTGAVGAVAVALFELAQASSDLTLGTHEGLATTLSLGAAAALAAVALTPTALRMLRN